MAERTVALGSSGVRAGGLIPNTLSGVQVPPQRPAGCSCAQAKQPQEAARDAELQWLEQQKVQHAF